MSRVSAAPSSAFAEGVCARRSVLTRANIPNADGSQPTNAVILFDESEQWSYRSR